MNVITQVLFYCFLIKNGVGSPGIQDSHKWMVKNNNFHQKVEAIIIEVQKSYRDFYHLLLITKHLYPSGHCSYSEQRLHFLQMRLFQPHPAEVPECVPNHFSPKEPALQY